jgi:hypothetical protein
VFEAAADGTVGFLISPTATVGRLKLFSATLEFATAVPEPGSMVLVGFGVLAMAATRVRRRADRAG